MLKVLLDLMKSKGVRLKICVSLVFVCIILLLVGPRCKLWTRRYRPLKFTKDGDDSPVQYDLTLQESVQTESKQKDFTFLINSRACSDDVRLLAVVLSAPPNVKRRDAIRRTWGSEFVATSCLKLVFVLGVTSDAGTIQKEQEVHGDLIQAHFEDSYGNLPFKTLAALQWTIQNCPRVDFILKIDDDVFLNTKLLLSKLSFAKSESRFFLGHLHYPGVPIRNAKSKWSASVEQYPFELYPPFVHGPAYVISRDLLGDLHACANYDSKVKLEDVFITGICGYIIKANHMSDCGFNIGKPNILSWIFREDLIIGHKYSPDQMEHIWNNLQQWKSAKGFFKFIGIPLSWI